MVCRKNILLTLTASARETYKRENDTESMGSESIISIVCVDSCSQMLIFVSVIMIGEIIEVLIL